MKKPIILTGIILLIGMGISYTLGVHRGEINTKEQVMKQKEKEIKALQKAHDKELKAMKRKIKDSTTSISPNKLTDSDRIVYDNFLLLFHNNNFSRYEKTSNQLLTHEQVLDYQSISKSYWDSLAQFRETNYKNFNLAMGLLPSLSEYYGTAAQYFDRYESMNEIQRKEKWDHVQSYKENAELTFQTFKEHYFASDDE
jgi:Na+/phosphate symporter